MQTVILTLIIPIISMIFTCAFMALWWADRERWPVLAFAACFGSVACGVAINIWIIERTTALGIVAYHLVSMGGLVALMWGVAKRAHVKAPIGFSTISIALVSPWLWYAIETGQPDAMRLVQNTHSALITAIVAMCLWYGSKRNWADHTLMWVLIALATFGFVRPALTLLLGASTGAGGQGFIILHAIHVLALATLLTLIALCLMASIVYGTMQREREKATTDPLTGLANRAAFEDQASKMLERASDENAPISLLVGDIDNFKSVNDTWGHSAGDKVITTFGSLVSKRIRSDDLAGRIGGEEFCILIWNCDEAAAVSLGNRLRLALASAHIEGFSADQSFTASFGITQWQSGESYTQAFGRADQALYAAKRAGRNRVEAASASSSEIGQSFDPDGNEGPSFSPFGSEGADVVSFAKIRASKPRG